MKQQVTATVKLPDHDAFQPTLETYSRAVQHCIDTAWRLDITSRSELHDACYYEVRDQYDLSAQLTCNVLQHAIETVKGADSKPDVQDAYPIRYNFPRSATVKGDWEELSLNTLQGRIRVPITIPNCYEEYLDWEVCESTLYQDDGTQEYYFAFVFQTEVHPDPDQDGRVVGVDLGVNKTAVTSTGGFYGTEVRDKREDWERQRAELQAKGTPGTRHRLQERGDRWKRFMTWKNHTISRRIVDKLDPGDALVLEDLTHIRQGNGNEWVHEWAFRQLQEFLEYKAHLAGVRVVYVKPAYTSQDCNKCRSRDTYRPDNGGWFECHACGHSLDADLNAARNIAQRYTRITGQAGTGKRAHDWTRDDAETAASPGVGLRRTAVQSPRLTTSGS